MSKTVNCFIPFADAKQVEATVAELKSYDYLVKTIYLLHDTTILNNSPGA